MTDQLTFARRVADEVAFMADGVVVERGHPEQIFTAPTHEPTRQS